MNGIALILALVLDRTIGEPKWLWDRLSHPVVWFGKFIEFVEKRFNSEKDDPEKRKMAGIGLVCAASVGLILLGAAFHFVFHVLGFVGIVLQIALVSIFLAHKSLIEHVEAVMFALRNESDEVARQKLSLIVGRDTSDLDRSGICRAALESLAENFCDGVVAPAFWYLIAGLPGLFVYKFINTADSMIGHKNERYIDFGWAAAKVDDVMNFVPARLSAVLIAAAHTVSALFSFSKDDLKLSWQRFKTIFNGTRKDAPFHRSVNAGWPEAAFAYALGLQFGGARSYEGEGEVDDITLNDTGAPNASDEDLETGIALAHYTWAGLIVVILLIALIF